MSEKTPLALWRVLGILVNYFVGFIYLYPKLGSMITFAVDPSATSMLPVVSFGIYMVMIVISVALAWPLLKESVDECVKKKKFWENIALLVVAGYLISLAASSIVMIITGAVDSNNEQLIQEQMRSFPVLMIFTAVIYAPIVEEIVFRGAIYRTLEPKFGFWISGLIAGLSFGMIHVIDSLLTGNFADVLYLLQYGGIGILFCYAYRVNRSIYSSMVLHFINNLVATLVTLALF